MYWILPLPDIQSLTLCGLCLFCSLCVKPIPSDRITIRLDTLIEMLDFSLILQFVIK